MVRLGFFLLSLLQSRFYGCLEQLHSDPDWGAVCPERLQVPALCVPKPFGLATAPGHAARIQEASCAPKEWDLLPMCCAVEPHLLAWSI